MKRPLAFVGFSMATALLLINIIGGSFYKILFSLAAVLFVISLLVTKLRQARVAPCIFGAALLACLIFMANYSNVEAQRSLDGQEVQTVFHIVDNVEINDDTYLYTVKTKSINAPNAPQNIKLKLYSEYEIDANYYDDLLSVIKYSSSYSDAFSSYGAFADGRYISASLDTVPIPLNNNDKPINYYILKARDYIKDTVTLHLKNDVGALSLALLTGDKTLLSDETYSNFKTCGVTHIMAVSGLHTSVICMGFYILLKNLGVKRNLRTFLSLFVLLLYMGITDFSVSVIRSAVMMSVLLLARVVNKKADTLNSLGLAVILLCFNPYAVSDPSAVLSVLSVLGMLVIKPKIDGKIKPKGNNKTIAYLYDGLTITLSVMITTFPAVWLFFANISLVAYIANLLLIPLAQFTMIGSLFTALFGFSKYLCTITSLFTYIPAKIMLLIVKFLSNNLGFLTFDVSNKIFIISYSAFLAFVGISLLIKNNVKFKAASALAFSLLIVSSAITVYESSVNTYLDISSTNVVVIYNNSAALVVGANSKNDYYEVKQCLSRSKSPNVLFVDCDYDNEKLSLLAKNRKEFLNNYDFNIDLCEQVNVKYQSGIISANINNIPIEIDKNYVTVNQSLCYARKAKYIYGDGDDTIISIRK